MAEVKSPVITKYMRRLLHQYSQLKGKNKDSGCMEFWNAVVLTAADAAQKSAFDSQIEDKMSRREIPQGLPIHVVSDPPGVRVGNGGSTLAVLEFLEKEYGEKMFEMKVLLIHAGGWSQRMPSATVLGKIFSVLPHGSPPFQMLDLKLALYWPFVPKVSAGVFLVCADDFLVFNLGEESDWTLPRYGFTALAHPSNIAVGRTHGVFVVSQDSMDTSKHVQILECVEVLQKPNDSRMKSQGALLEGTKHVFADGISLEGEVVYTDSCYFFGTDVMEKLLQFKKSVGDLNCEIDAYGDFLQALGKKATIEYVHNVSNVSQCTDNLIDMRKSVFNLLKECDIHVLALNASAFIHIGTTKELIHHLCRDQDFQDQMAFDRNIFNLWFVQTQSKTPDDKYGNCVSTNGPFIQRGERDPSKVSEHSCVVHSSLSKESVITDDCYLEFCDFDIPICTSKTCILSNCQISRSETQLKSLSIPENIFLHTIPLHTGDKAVEYVTVFFKIEDNLKKATSLNDLESLSFLGSDIGQYLSDQRLQVEDILPNKETKEAENANNDDGVSIPVKVSLWKLKLYPASPSMTASLENAVVAITASERQKIPKLSQKLYSLEDIVKMKNVKAMLNFRQGLYEKIQSLM